MQNKIIIIVASLALSACSRSPAEKEPADSESPDASGADTRSRADGGAQWQGQGQGDAAHNGNDSGPGHRDSSTPPPDMRVHPSTAYQEPASIRGGACADLAAATDACGNTSAASVYCSLADPTEVVMATCSTSGRDQCEVLDRCGTGWSACNATQYIERGGRDVQPAFSTTNRAWLAACVQDANGNGLRNEPCTPCGEYEPPYEPAVMWYCEDGSVVYEGGMAGDNLGVVTSPICFRVGENSPNNSAYWALDFASAGTSFVVCCKDDF